MKILLGIIGFIIIAGSINGGNWKYITNWSSSELIGANITTIIITLICIYLIINALKK
jgi:hypothetical protein